MASSSKLPADPDLDRAIARDASDFIRELEVERIIRAFKLNPYDILDLPITASESDIKKQYRKKSLLIHPDKYKHARGIEAFDFLKKAEGTLSDEGKRKDVDNVMAHSRNIVLKSILPPGIKDLAATPDDDPRLTGLNPSLDSRIREKAKEVFVEEELAKRRAQKLTYANEGAEAIKKDQEVSSKKRKKEDEQVWEATRDSRVNNWRDFAKTGTGGAKKKVKKTNVLG